MSLPFYLESPGPHWYDDVHKYALDLETTNKDKGDPLNAANRVVLAACDNGARIAVHDDLDFEWLEGGCVLVAHNAKFELGWMLRYGYDLAKFLVWDTMIGEYVLAGNRQVELSLDATAKRYGLPGKDPVIDNMMKAGICPSEMPERWLRERVRYDVRTTMEVMLRQRVLLEQRGLMPVFFTRCIVTPVLAAIEANGMRVDKSRVDMEHAIQSIKRQVSNVKLDMITGGINLRSRPQLAEFLYDKMGFSELLDRDGNPIRTATGLRATDSESLDRLKATTKDQRDFLRVLEEKTSAETRLSKSLEVFKAAGDMRDGLLLGQFNQCVTQTHRLSASSKKIVTAAGKSRGAQFQNMPREYKKLFRPHEDGRVLTELDYSQLEFRVAVELGQDDQGMKDILSGHDVHRFTASVLKQKPYANVTDEERQDAKPRTFKPLYGGSAGTPREKAYYAAFRERYPGINNVQQRWLAEVLRTKQLTTVSGLIYYWPDTRVQASGYVTNTPSIFNYPVQSFATADIVLIGAVHAYWRLDGMDVMMVNTIHDSILLDHGPDFTRDLPVLAKAALIDDVVAYVDKVYGHKIVVPLAGEYVTSPHWADKSEKLASGKF